MYVNRKMKQELEEVVRGMGRPECRSSDWVFKYHLTYEDLVERIVNVACEWVKKTGSTDLIRKLATAEADVNEMDEVALAERHKYGTKRGLFDIAYRMQLLMSLLKVNGLQDILEDELMYLYTDTYTDLEDNVYDEFYEHKDEVPVVAAQLSLKFSSDIIRVISDDKTEEFLNEWVGNDELLLSLYESCFTDMAENYIGFYAE